MTAPSRHFIELDGRQLFLLRQGSGAAVVLLHGAGRSSTELLPLLGVLGEGVTALAFDLPGHGLSEELPQSAPTPADYAASIRAALDALDAGVCAVYGTQLGAAVAIELARAQPERFPTLVLDRLPTGLPPGWDLERYAPAFAPEEEGSHLLRRWAAIRDEHVFAPWYQRVLSARIDADVPPVEELHETMLDQLRGRGDPRLGVRAALGFEVDRAARDLQVTIHLLLPEADALRTRLERLPPELDGRVERHPLGDRQEATSLAAELLAPATSGGPPKAPPSPGARSGQTTFAFAPTPWGELFVRYRADAPGLPIVLLHPSWATSWWYEELIDALAERRPVYAIDRLGMGDSAKPDLDLRPELEFLRVADYAGSALAAMSALGVERFDLLGAKGGSAVAMEAAIMAPGRVNRLIFDGFPMIPEEKRLGVLANYNVDKSPRLDGSHLLREWDAQRRSLWYPNHRLIRAYARTNFPVETPAQMQNATVTALKAGRWFWKIIAAVYPHPLRQRLPLVTVPTLVSSRSDDIFADGTAEVVSLLPDGRPGLTPQNARPDGPFAYALGSEAAAHFVAFLDA